MVNVFDCWKTRHIISLCDAIELEDDIAVSVSLKRSSQLAQQRILHYTKYHIPQLRIPIHETAPSLSDIIASLMTGLLGTGQIVDGQGLARLGNTAACGLAGRVARGEEGKSLGAEPGTPQETPGLSHVSQSRAYYPLRPVKKSYPVTSLERAFMLALRCSCNQLRLSRRGQEGLTRASSSEGAAMAMEAAREVIMKAGFILTVVFMPWRDVRSQL